jgi:hypothetical protein
MGVKGWWKKAEDTPVWVIILKKAVVKTARTVCREEEWV